MRVLLAVPDADDRETSAAADWLAQHGFAWTQASVTTVDRLTLASADVVWCHCGLARPALLAWSAALRQRIVGEGGVVLSLGAATLPHAWGLDPVAPHVVAGVWSDTNDPLWDPAFHAWPDYPHIRGLQGWAIGTHPLFAGLHGGTFTRQMRDGDAIVDVALPYDVDSLSSARVIGMERAYVRLNAGHAVAWEYASGERRLLCLGAHIALLDRDPPLMAQRDRLLGNALSLAARRSGIATSDAHWPDRLTRDVTRQVFQPPALAPLRDAPRPEVVQPPDASPFAIAGRRTLVVGSESGGVAEIWIHPLGVVTFDGPLLVDGRPAVARLVEVGPASVTRHLLAARGTIREAIVPAADQPAVRLDYLPSAGCDAVVQVQLRLAFRLEWPFDRQALHPLTVSVDASPDGARHAVRIVGADGQCSAVVTTDSAADLHVRWEGGEPHVAVTGVPGAPLRLLCAAATDGQRVLLRSLATHDLLSPRVDEYDQVERGLTRSATPDRHLNDAFRWSGFRLHQFVADVPGFDSWRSVLAGFAPSRPGWGGSRPGYAWFFGRDACWCADAMLALGMFREVADVIRFLAASADVSGKILHEYTTSGAVHYDAADSTPLFLRLAAAYVEWSGDLETVRTVWDAVRQALQFVLTTDRDADGLPENAGVGHGWIESGPLGGGRVTSYLAAIWLDAMRRLGPLAIAVDDPVLADTCRVAWQRGAAAFERRFVDRHHGRIALQLQPDGSPNFEPTALDAVPVLLGLVTDDVADAVLNRFDSPEFTAPWGVRLLPRSNATYAPRGYHSGAVWPLFTGWVSLAAFAHGHSAFGLRLLQANAGLGRRGAKGAFDEVLDGDSGEGAGVCADQAWSAAMVAAPLVCGLWGVRANAVTRELRVAPQLPDDWDQAELRQLRVGDSLVSIAAASTDRGRRSWRYTIDHYGTTLRWLWIERLVPESRAVLASEGEVTPIERPCRRGWRWMRVAVPLRDGRAHVELIDVPTP